MPGVVGFYAGVPLITADGSVVGVLCVWDEHPRELGPEDIAALEHFARDALALWSCGGSPTTWNLLGHCWRHRERCWR